MKIKVPAILFALTTAFLPVEALADKCGKDDRVSLPSCSNYVTGVRNQQARVWVHNKCDYDLTVKVDIHSHSDKRHDLKAGESWSHGAFVHPDDFRVYCCPRYSRCR